MPATAERRTKTERERESAARYFESGDMFEARERFFADVVAEVEDLDRQQQVEVMRYITEQSVEDGVAIAKQLGTEDTLFLALYSVDFVQKHTDFTDELFRYVCRVRDEAGVALPSHIDLSSVFDEIDFLKEYPEKYVEHKEGASQQTRSRYRLKQFGLTALKQNIDDYYAHVYAASPRELLPARHEDLEAESDLARVNRLAESALKSMRAAMLGAESGVKISRVAKRYVLDHVDDDPQYAAVVDKAYEQHKKELEGYEDYRLSQVDDPDVPDYVGAYGHIKTKEALIRALKRGHGPSFFSHELYDTFGVSEKELASFSSWEDAPEDADADDIAKLAEKRRSVLGKLGVDLEDPKVKRQLKAAKKEHSSAMLDSTKMQLLKRHIREELARRLGVEKKEVLLEKNANGQYEVKIEGVKDGKKERKSVEPRELSPETMERREYPWVYDEVVFNGEHPLFVDRRHSEDIYDENHIRRGRLHDNHTIKYVKGDDGFFATNVENIGSPIVWDLDSGYQNSVIDTFEANKKRVDGSIVHDQTLYYLVGEKGQPDAYLRLIGREEGVRETHQFDIQKMTKNGLEIVETIQDIIQIEVTENGFYFIQKQPNGELHLRRFIDGELESSAEVLHPRAGPYDADSVTFKTITQENGIEQVWVVGDVGTNEIVYQPTGCLQDEYHFSHRKIQDIYPLEGGGVDDVVFLYRGTHENVAKVVVGGKSADIYLSSDIIPDKVFSTDDGEIYVSGYHQSTPLIQRIYDENGRVYGGTSKGRYFLHEGEVFFKNTDRFGKFQILPFTGNTSPIYDIRSDHLPMEKEVFVGDQYFLVGDAGVGTGQRREYILTPTKQLTDFGLWDDIEIQHENDWVYFVCKHELLAQTVVYSAYVGEGESETIDVNQIVEEKFDLNYGMALLNAMADPEHMDDYIGGFMPKTAREATEESYGLAENVTQWAAEHQHLAIQDMAAIRDDLSPAAIKRMAHEFFPDFFADSAVQRYEREQRQEQPDGFAGIGFGDPFASVESARLYDGDPREKNHREIMQFRENEQGFFATQRGYDYDDEKAEWRPVPVKTERPKADAFTEKTATILSARVGVTVLPETLDARILPERVKGVTADGKEISLPVREVNDKMVVDVPHGTGIEKIIYTQEVSRYPVPPSDVTDRDMQRMKKRLQREHGATLYEKLPSLPTELRVFVASLKDKRPKEQLIAIQNYIRKIGYYDMDNGALAGQKHGVGFQERLAIMRSRMHELVDSGQGKYYAGVCADFALMGAAMLRELGFPAGVAEGVSASGKTATTEDMHAIATVLWPDGEHGGVREIPVDVTPSAASADQEAFLASIRESSVEDMEVEHEAGRNEMQRHALEQMERVGQMLAEGDMDAIREMQNGALETMLNAVLHYGVKAHHTAAIRGLFNVVRYSPLDIRALTSDRIEARAAARSFLVEEVEKIRADAPGDALDGTAFFSMLESFVHRYERELGDTQAAIDLLDEVVDVVARDIDPVEAKAAVVVLQYLRAQQLMKRKTV